MHQTKKYDKDVEEEEEGAESKNKKVEETEMEDAEDAKPWDPSLTMVALGLFTYGAVGTMARVGTVLGAVLSVIPAGLMALSVWLVSRRMENKQPDITLKYIAKQTNLPNITIADEYDDDETEYDEDDEYIPEDEREEREDARRAEKEAMQPEAEEEYETVEAEVQTTATDWPEDIDGHETSEPLEEGSMVLPKIGRASKDE
jgi:hypothetical protein